MLLALIAAATGGAVLLASDDGVDQQANLPGGTGSWARGYDSVGELLDDPSTIAIVGVVVDIGEPYLVGDSGGDIGIPFTDATVEVSEVLFGQSRVAVGERLIVRQTGSLSGVRAFVLTDSRLLIQDEPVLLFLIFDPLFEKHAITGGRSGFFTIDGDQVKHANLDSGHPLSDFVAGRTVQQVKDDVVRLGAESR